MVDKIAVMFVVLVTILTGCLGGGSQGDPLQQVADNSDGDYTRSDAVEAADRALEFHEIETTEENRERLAELALEAAQQDPNQTPDNILICVWDRPLEGDEGLDSWQQVENLAEACA